MRRELPSGGVADGYQSNPIQSNPSHLPLLMGNPLSSSHISLERLFTSLAQLVAANRRVERASLGSPNDNLKDDWKGAATRGLNAGLLWPRSRVFVIIPPASIFGVDCFPFALCLALLYNASTCNVILEISLVHRLCLLGECSHYFDALFEICLFLVTFRSMHVLCRRHLRFPRACSLAGVVSFKGIVEPSFSESTGVYRAMAQRRVRRLGSPISIPSQYSVLWSRYTHHHPEIHCAHIAFLILTFFMMVSAPTSRDVDL